MNTSGRPRPAAVTRIRTSPGPGVGPSRSTRCSTSSGSPAAWTSHAFTSLPRRSASARSVPAGVGPDYTVITPRSRRNPRAPSVVARGRVGRGDGSVHRWTPVALEVEHGLLVAIAEIEVAHRDDQLVARPGG